MKKLWGVLCLISLSLFAFSFSGYSMTSNKYTDGCKLETNAVINFDGVTITPVEWILKEDEEDDYAPTVGVRLMIENQSRYSVWSQAYYGHINNQMVDRSTIDCSEKIKPGEKGELILRFEEYYLQKQRIERISEISTSFFIDFTEESEDGTSNGKRIITDCVTIARGKENGLKPFIGREVYQNETLSIQASDVLREFPGAYTAGLHIQNRGESLLGLTVRTIDINGKLIEAGTNLDAKSWCYLVPGKSVDIYNLAFLKNSKKPLIPLAEIATVTLEIKADTYVWSQESERLEVVEEREPVRVTIDIKQ